jgi:hypothetical protein
MVLAVVIGGTMGLHGALEAQSLPAGAVEVPLAEHGGRLVVPVSAADGTKLDFILTTGNAVTVLTQSTVDAWGAAPELTLAGKPVPVEQTHVLEDAGLETEGRRFAGMISPNMLSDFNVLIDLPNERLVLAPTGRSVDWGDVPLSDPVPLRVFHGVVLSMDVTMGDDRIPAMLELGTPRLLANQAVADAGHIGDGVASSLTLAGHTWTDLPGEVSDHPVIGRFSPNGTPFVLVGTPVTWDCAIAISWIHAELRTCAQ